MNERRVMWFDIIEAHSISTFLDLLKQVSKDGWRVVGYSYNNSTYSALVEKEYE